ncbi:MAG: pyridoxamine 5'-phosphate oxidase family protein, partial [Candidatus Bathyarchaeota archaeon]
YATLCTHNKDGSIHAVPVGYMYIDGQIVIVSHTGTRKNRNILRDSMVSLLVDTKKPIRGVLIYGKAQFDDDVLPMVMRMFTQSTPADKVELVSREYLSMVDCVVIRVTPERMVSFDHEKYDVFKNLSDKYDLGWNWW